MSSNTLGKASTSGVKNLINAFDEAGDEPLEHMPDYEQFVSGNYLKIDEIYLLYGII